MMNILLPMSGPNRFESDDLPYPKPIIELAGRPVIEHVVENLSRDIGPSRFIFVVNASDCNQYHLDDVLSLITHPDRVILRLDNETKGAACSALMAIDEIDNDEPLIISNSDHIIEHDLGKVIAHFVEKDVDGGVICFDSVHPKWSFVRLGANDEIVEAAEKRPLSRNAIAGFYYFRNGRYFVDAVMRMIEKDASNSGIYYIAPCFNEMVLANRRLAIYRIPAASYFNFSTFSRLSEYEMHLRNLAN